MQLEKEKLEQVALQVKQRSKDIEEMVVVCVKIMYAASSHCKMIVDDQSQTLQKLSMYFCICSGSCTSSRRRGESPCRFQKT